MQCNLKNGLACVYEENELDGSSSGSSNNWEGRKVSVEERVVCGGERGKRWRRRRRK